MGVVNEVLTREWLMARPREIAEQIVSQPRHTTRYTRVLVTQTLRRMMNDDFGNGVALEGLEWRSVPEYGPDFQALARETVLSTGNV